MLSSWTLSEVKRTFYTKPLGRSFPSSFQNEFEPFDFQQKTLKRPPIKMDILRIYAVVVKIIYEPGHASILKYA